MPGIAGDVGVERGTQRPWLDMYGTGRKTAHDGTTTSSPPKSARYWSLVHDNGASEPLALDQPRAAWRRRGWWAGQRP